jgi:hypothetical protein
MLGCEDVLSGDLRSEAKRLAMAHFDRLGEHAHVCRFAIWKSQPNGGVHRSVDTRLHDRWLERQID